MHVVYILHSPTYDKYYVGQTPEVETRLLFHNELSENSYTSRYRPWELKRVIEVGSRSLAVQIGRRKQRNYRRTCFGIFPQNTHFNKCMPLRDRTIFSRSLPLSWTRRKMTKQKLMHLSNRWLFGMESIRHWSKTSKHSWKNIVRRINIHTGTD